jgi:hypothetical protein
MTACLRGWMRSSQAMVVMDSGLIASRCPGMTIEGAPQGEMVNEPTPPMSDIGILNDPLSLIAIALIFGSPGLLLGGVAGALLWRGRRVSGGSGRGRRPCAVAGGWMVLKDVV